MAQSVIQSEVDGMLTQSVEKGDEEGEWRGECSWDGAGEQLNYLSLNSFVNVNSFANTTNPSRGFQVMEIISKHC